MALLFIDGFDHYDDALEKWDGISGPVSPPSYHAGRIGGFAVGFTSTNDREMTKTLDSNKSEVYLGMAFKVDSAPVTQVIASFWDSAGTAAASLQTNVSGALSLHLGEGGTQIATSSTGIISAGVWYYIEIHYTPLNSGGTMEVKLDEVSVASATGVDTTAGLENVLSFRIGSHGNTSNGHYFDDLYILDTSGTSNNSYLGDVRVITEPVTVDTAQADFTPSVGTDNFAMLDEINTIDDDTTYCENGSIGATDRFTTGALGVTGTVFGVQVCTAARKTDVASRAFKHTIKSGATTKEDLTEHNLSSSYHVSTDVYDTNPNTSAAWTVTEVDNLEVGYKVTI